MFIHDDVDVIDPDMAVLALMEIPECVAVGFGGAKQLGGGNLYREPYSIRNMARARYQSNQVDAEVHGLRSPLCARVAVLDAFFMAVRTDWLKSVGGWPEQLTHHCLDLWLACEAARRRKQIWMAGVACNHRGGGTSVKPEYRNAKWLQGSTLELDHAIPHRWLYEEYRDVLPIAV